MSGKRIKMLRKVARQELKPLIEQNNEAWNIIIKSRPWYIPQWLYYRILGKLIDFQGNARIGYNQNLDKGLANAETERQDPE